eukprot:Opistho-2@63575
MLRIKLRRHRHAVIAVCSFASFALCALVAHRFLWEMEGNSSLPPVVLIHGYKASHLRDATTGDRAWLTARQALTPWNESIALPINWKEENGRWVQDGDALVADGCIRSVGASIFKRSVYDKFFHTMERQKRDMNEFSYDWRRNPEENARKFLAFLEDLAKIKGAPLQIVAHSMGGLVTLAAMNMLHDHIAAGERPSSSLKAVFNSVLFVGVPFHRRVTFLEDLHKGSMIGLNSHIISYHVQATFTSVYTLFPLDGRGLVDAPAVSSAHPYAPEDAIKGDHAPVDADQPTRYDPFDIHFWKSHNLSIFRDDSPYPRDAAETHMT